MIIVEFKRFLHRTREHLENGEASVLSFLMLYNCNHIVMTLPITTVKVVPLQIPVGKTTVCPSAQCMALANAIAMALICCFRV